MLGRVIGRIAAACRHYERRCRVEELRGRLNVAFLEGDVESFELIARELTALTMGDPVVDRIVVGSEGDDRQPVADGETGV